MDALASYGSDSDSDTQEDEEIEQKQSSLFSELPQSTSIQSVGLSNRKRPLDQTEDTLESIVQPHSWEKEEAPKPPPKVKRTGPVKIVLPELTDSTLSDDEEEEETGASKISKNSGVSDSSVKLLSMLPAPKTQSKAKLMLPGAISRPKPVSKPVDIAPKFVENLKKPMVATSVEEDTSDSEESSDFLGLGADYSVDVGPVESEDLGATVYGPAKPETFPEEEDLPGPSTSGGSMHPSQMYNYVNEDNSMFFPTEEEETTPGTLTDDKAQKLIYKHEMEKWGVRREEMGTPEIVDLNVNSRLGSAVDVRAQLLRNLHGKPIVSPAEAAKKDKKENPGATAKRKHQITYLAFMAKQKEEELKDQWATSRFNRNQSRNKYGF